MSKFNGVKTNNARIDAKIEVRKKTIDIIGCDNARVLEIFCGSGEMYDAVWKDAAYYVGIDKIKFFDNRKTICGDADKALRIVDLNQFNIIDIDAYGSPYDVMNYIIRNIKFDDKLCFIVTDGVDMDMRMGRICAGIRNILEMECNIIKKAHLMHDRLISMIIKKIAQTLNANISYIDIAKGKTGAGMRYYSFMLVKSVA